ncbi:hypothetical protein M3Y99_01085400 [Aphelenchoides fujianensis]|nr:hypothetical protein M3Y99_01085400 [Aphelenchoides fujianensis]
MARLYVGGLNSDMRERDLESTFRRCGRIREILIKGGFGFVEYDDPRDASDAIREFDGREVLGCRLTVEHTRRRGERGGRGDFRRGSSPRGGRPSRYGPPVQTRHRLVVENLSTRCSWQDLKDMMRNAGEVTFADAHKQERNKALVCFADRESLRRAIDKYQDKDINGRRIRLIDDSEGASSRSRSRSRGRSTSRNRTAVSRSRSPHSRSRSPVEQRNGRRSASRSRSRSPRNGRSPSRSPSPR